MKHLTEGNNTSQLIQKFILNDIFLEGEYKVIRVFIDGLLSSSKLPNAVLQQYGNRIHEVGEYGVKILHQAAREDNANIVGFLLHSVQAGQQTDTLNELLLKQDDEGRTAWHKAVLMGNIQVLMRLWEWAKKVLKTQELKSELLLPTVKLEDLFPLKQKYSRKHTALQRAADQDKTEVFLKLWEWSKEELTTEEVKNEVLLAKDYRKQTIWHMAAKNDKPVLLEKLWDWAKEKLTPEELNNKLLLAKDDVAQTAFHVAAEGGIIQVLQKIWECSKEKLTAEEIKINLLLANVCEDKTVFHVAARGGETTWYNAAEKDHTKVLEILWKWAKEELTSEELINMWLLGKDNRKRTAWHLAAQKGNIDSLRRLWNWAKQVLTAEELKSKWMLGKDDRKRTAFDMAAEEGNTEVLEILQEWALQEFRSEELSNVLC